MKILARSVLLVPVTLLTLAAVSLPQTRCFAQTANGQQSRPSTKDAVDVFRALPGIPEDWLYPGSTPRIIAIQPSSMTGTRRTQTVSLDTKASLRAVTKYYARIVEKSGVRGAKTEWRDSRWVVQFDGGSVMAGRENHKTFILIVVMEPVVA